MPRRIVTKVKFTDAYQRLSETDRHLADSSLRKFEHYLRTGEAPMGLGIKHLGSRTYEFRVGLSLRIVYVVEQDSVILSLLGTHDDVRRFLRQQ